MPGLQERRVPLSIPRHPLATTIRLFDRIASRLPGRNTAGKVGNPRVAPEARLGAGHGRVAATHAPAMENHRVILVDQGHETFLCQRDI